jgi:tetratricopeptide (TPR) repeat protein
VGAEAAGDRQAALELLGRAEQKYLQAISFSPHEADNYEFLSHLYNRAGVRLDPAYFGRAEEVALDGLEYAPNNPDINLEAGTALLYSGQLEQARVRLERANVLDARDAEAAALLGDAFYALGDKEAARTAYERVLALNPNYGTVQQALDQLDQELGTETSPAGGSAASEGA